MDADGSNEQNLTNNPAIHAWQVSWSPDGSQLAFTARGRLQTSEQEKQALGVAGILLEAGILMGIVLLAVRQWSLPFGSLALMFTVNAFLMSVLEDQYQFLPPAFLAGVIADLLVRQLQPSPERLFALRLFAFATPLIFYTLYFLTVALTQGTWWSMPLWSGAPVLAGVVGLLLSYLLVPPSSELQVPHAS